MQKDGTQVGYPCTRTQIKQPTNGLAGSDKPMAEGDPLDGKGPGSEDGPSVSLADEGVVCSEEDLSTLVRWSVSLLMSLRQLVGGGSRMRGSSSSGDEEVSKVKVVR